MPRTIVPYLFIGFDKLGFEILSRLARDVVENEPSECRIHHQPIFTCAHHFICMTPPEFEVRADFEEEVPENLTVLKPAIGDEKRKNLNFLLREVEYRIDEICGSHHENQFYNFVGIDGGTPVSKIMIFIIADLRSRFVRDYLREFLDSLLMEVYSTKPNRGRALFYISPFLVVRTQAEKDSPGIEVPIDRIRSSLQGICEIAEDKERFFSSFFLMDGNTKGGNDLWSDEGSIERYLVELFKLFFYVDIFGNNIKFFFSTKETLFFDPNKPVYGSLGIKLLKYPYQELLSFAANKGMVELCKLMVMDDARDLGDKEFFKQQHGQIQQRLEEVKRLILQETPKLKQLEYDLGEEPESILGKFKQDFNSWKDTIQTYYKEKRESIKESNQNFCKTSNEIREDVHKNLANKIDQFTSLYKNGLTFGLRFIQMVKNHFHTELDKQETISWIPKKPPEIEFETDLKELEGILREKPNLKAFAIYSILHLIIFPPILSFLTPFSAGIFSIYLVRWLLWLFGNLFGVFVLRYFILRAFKKKIDAFIERVEAKGSRLMREHRNILDTMLNNLIQYWQSRISDHFFRYLSFEESIWESPRSYLELIANAGKESKEGESGYREKLKKKLAILLAEPKFVNNYFLRYFFKEEDMAEVRKSVNDLLGNVKEDQIRIVKEAFEEEKYLKGWKKLYPEEFSSGLRKIVKSELKNPVKELLINFPKRLSYEELKKESDSIPIPLFFDSTKIPDLRIKPDFNEKYVSVHNDFQSLVGKLQVNGRFEMSISDTILFFSPLHHLSAKALHLFQEKDH